MAEVLVHVEFDGGGRGRVSPWPAEPVVPADEGFVAEICRAGEQVVLRKVPDGNRLGSEGAPEGLARREILGVPVCSDTAERRVTLGVILLCDKVRGGYGTRESRLGSEEGQVATSFASMLGAVIGARQSAEFGKELSMAQEIQSQILPAAPARVRGFDLAGDYRTSGEVGGDYFDYVPLADGRTLAVVADVSGHNLASGMMMVSARATLRTLASVRQDPAQLFEDLAASMFTDLTRTERFITAAGVALRPGEHAVEIVNAGHNETLVYRGATGDIEAVRAESTVLGFMPRTEYGAQRVDLRPGDCVLLYTDGVTEIVDVHGEMFGEDRLCDVLRRAGDGSAAAVIAAVFDAVQQFRAAGERGDDVTVVAIKAVAPGANS